MRACANVLACPQLALMHLLHLHLQTYYRLGSVQVWSQVSNADSRQTELSLVCLSLVDL